jgi:hypothetical protein
MSDKLNAKALPDLVEALEQLLEYTYANGPEPSDVDNVKICQTFVDKGKAALAKAKFESE